MKRYAGTIFGLVILLTAVYGVAQTYIDQTKKKAEQTALVETKRKLDKIQQECLVEALWNETRGESDIGLYAVLSVIVNRKNSGDFPKTFCAVVHQRGQFSYYSPRLQLKPIAKLSERDRLQLIYKIAADAVEGVFKPILLPDVMWFHSANISTDWSAKLQKVVRIDSHNFYKEK